MLGVWIKAERSKRKVSQAKLSKFLGIQQARLSAWEMRKISPPAEIKSRVSKILFRIDKELSIGNNSIFKKNM